MTRTSLLFAFLLLATRAAAQEVAGGAAVPDGEGVAVLLDSARVELERGRPWHASRLLRAAKAGESPELLPLLVEAEAGWGNWGGVVELIQEPLASGSLTGGGFWFLLGRSLEAREEWEGAAAAYNRALDAAASQGGQGPAWESLEARIRWARCQGRLGAFSSALEGVRAVYGEDSRLGAWLALDVAADAASEGSRGATAALLEMVPWEVFRVEGWDLPARAVLAAGDSAGAEVAYWSAIPTLTSGADQAVAWERVARLRLARGDSLGAKGAFHQVLRHPAPSAVALGAAVALRGLGLDSAGVALASARVFAQAGGHREALEGYSRFEELGGDAGGSSVRLAMARSHLALGDAAEALELTSGVVDSSGEGTAVEALTLLAESNRALGRGGEARAAEDTLVTRYPDSDAALGILFSRADALERRGDRDGAVGAFQLLIAMAPSRNLAGEARMRIAGSYLARNRLPEALAVYRDYMRDFPSGRRWDEVAFWAGHTLRTLGREEEAREVWGELRGRFALSYYSVLAGFLMGRPYDPPVPSTSDSLPFPETLREGLAELDRLLGAGLELGLDHEVRRLEEVAGELEGEDGGGDVRLRLAQELNARGLTREGINLGWAVQGEGRPLDRNLMMAIYPFPFREAVLAEARERGVDPFLMAGLIRQESAFWHLARSRADARGLMQVLPGTGRELARRQGPGGFDADEHLYRPEINLHLGMAFFVDMRRRFGDDPSIILSAYNAGPTRALRWREYPEAGDLARFVERIPFTETRGYVKNVLRNREVYAWLYGDARVP